MTPELELEDRARVRQSAGSAEEWRGKSHEDLTCVRSLCNRTSAAFHPAYYYPVLGRRSLAVVFAPKD